jgi:hypothetical protein
MWTATLPIINRVIWHYCIDIATTNCTEVCVTSTERLRSRVRRRVSCTVLKTSGVGDCSAEFNSIATAPSEARLCLLGESPSSGSPGKAPGTECCVSVGNNEGEAYTRRSWAAMRQREGIEPRYEMKPWMPTLLAKRKATPKKPIARALAGPPGSKDRST